MSSDQEHRQPNISNESFLKGETVNPSSFREVPSSRRAPRRQPPNEAVRQIPEASGILLNRRIPNGTYGCVGGRGLATPSYPVI